MPTRTTTALLTTTLGVGGYFAASRLGDFSANMAQMIALLMASGPVLAHAVCSRDDRAARKAPPDVGAGQGGFSTRANLAAADTRSSWTLPDAHSTFSALDDASDIWRIDDTSGVDLGGSDDSSGSDGDGGGGGDD